MQRYRCGICKQYFQSPRRDEHHNKKLWNEYVWHKQTLTQLAQKHSRSIQYIRGHLEQVSQTHTTRALEPTVIIADTTFWGRHYGVCVFRSPTLKRNLWWIDVDRELMATYRYGRKMLEEEGWTILAAVTDGRRGLTTVFKDIPVQMCHFHQKQILRRYLTYRPQTQAGRELLAVAKTLTYAQESVFTLRLEHWHRRWGDYTKERTWVLGTNYWYYTHKDVRKSYLSLKRNLPYLFTYQKYPELTIPTTTNSLDGSFSQLKTRLRCHQGLSKERRYKVISEILRGAD